jgi:hypothetical protein
MSTKKPPFDEAAVKEDRVKPRFTFPTDLPLSQLTAKQRHEQLKAAFTFLCQHCGNYSPAVILDDETAHRALYVLRELTYDNERFITDKHSLTLLTTCKLHVLLANLMHHVMDVLDASDYQSSWEDLAELERQLGLGQSPKPNQEVKRAEPLVIALFALNCCICMVAALVAVQFADRHVARVVHKLLDYDLVRVLTRVYKRIERGLLPSDDAYFVLFFLDKLVLNPHLDRAAWLGYKLEQVLHKTEPVLLQNRYSHYPSLTLFD